MPYFFILPAYIILLLGLFGAAVATRFMPRFHSASGYIFGGALGSLVGFLLVNAAVILAGVAPAWLAQRFNFPNWLLQTSKFFVAAMLLIGPFIGSAIGVLLGFAAGFFIVLRRRNFTLK
jgi:hypothetical protein